MITREQVADLRDGDVVELACANWTPGTTIRGPIWGAALDESEEDREPFVGPVQLRRMGPGVSITVVSRAPRPLYVNHPRTEPVPGDVVRDADDHLSATTWVRVENEDGPTWIEPTFGSSWGAAKPLPRLRLLVEGETGQVVP